MTKFVMNETPKLYAGKTPEDRFWEKVEKPDGEGGCWKWSPTFRSGDGRPRYRQMEASRWAYLHFVGPYPSGYHLDHFKCDNKECVNFNHIKPITAEEHGRKSQAQRLRHGNRYEKR
jgi:hypothetical protein